MKTILVVTVPFGDYAKGDQITDATAMEAALVDHDAHVVRTTIEDPPAKPSKAAD